MINRWSAVRGILFFVACVVGLRAAEARAGYIFVHSVAELFSIIVAATIFVLVWSSRQFEISGYLRVLGVMCLFAGGFDLLHMLAYQGMGVFPDTGANPATQLWMAARYLQSVSLLLAPLFVRRQPKVPWIMLAYALIASSLLAAIVGGRFPVCFIDGQGLTPFKLYSEYAICLILLASIALLWRQRRNFDPLVLRLLVAALLVSIASELAFTLYTDPYGMANFIGHYLKIVAFYLLYKAIVETALSKPFQLLFRELKEREAALQLAKQEAERANKTKDEFLATLSHELRTPLTPVLGAVSMLQGEAGLSQEMREDLAMIGRNVELQARLIDDLLDLTRISRGKLELCRRDVDVHAVLEGVFGICGSELNRKQIRFTAELEARNCFVRADPARLSQVFWNLLKNAVKFTPQLGTVTVRTSNPVKSPDHVRVEVTDNGIGIDPKNLARIFNAFEQGGQAITRQFGGLGLGLSICRALVQLHEGTISASSAGPNRGASFVVEIPAAAPAPATPLSQVDSPAEKRNVRILLVEDHADTARLTANVLRRLNHEVRTAASVQLALQAVDAHSFDLVISDLGLPDGSGLDLMRQLSQQYGLKGICLSGYGMDQDIRASRDAGFVQHLIKPVSVEHLQSAIEQVTAGHPGR